MSEEYTEGQEYDDYQYPEETYTYNEEEVPISFNPWSIVYDEASEQNYYYNCLTYETSWEIPTDYYSYEEVEGVEVEITEIIPEVNADYAVADDDAANWTEYYDEIYGTYYYNTVTFETTYDMPSCMVIIENNGLVIPIEEEEEEEEDEVVIEEVANGVSNIENKSQKKDEDIYLPFSAATLSKFHEFSDKGNTTSAHSIEFLTEVLLSPLKLIKSSTNSPMKSKFDLKTDYSTNNASILAESIDNNDKENNNVNVHLEDSQDLIEYELSIDYYNEDNIDSNEKFKEFLNDHQELKIITREMILYLTKKSFKTYAISNFNIDLSGKPLQNEARLNNILSWEPILMTESLTKLNPNLTRDALTYRKRIMEYMGDKKTNKAPISNLYAILIRMIDAPECLRDEIYCQICKQIRNNISFHSTYNGWQLMLVCLTSFPSSIEFLPYLMSFIASYIDINIEENDEYNEFATDSEVIAKLMEKQIIQKKCENNKIISKLAERSLKYCIKSSKCNRRQELPSRIEVNSIQLDELISIPVYFVNGTQILVKVHSWTTVKECNKIIAEISGMPDKDSKAFSLFQSIIPIDYNINIIPIHLTLDDDCRVLDIVSYMQRFNEMEEMRTEKKNIKKKKNNSILIYKVKYFLDIDINSYDNESILNMYYIQAVHDTSEGTYPCSKQDYIVLTQLQNQEKIYSDDKNNVLVRESRLNYMEYIRSIKSYGSFFYYCESSYITNNTSQSIPSTVILAVSNNKLLLLNPELSSIIDDIDIRKIHTWGYSLDTCTFVIKVRNSLITNDNKTISTGEQHVRYFKTNQSKDINDLLNAYSNFSKVD